MNKCFFVLMILALHSTQVHTSEAQTRLAAMDLGNIYGNCETLAQLLEYQIITLGEPSNNTHAFIEYISTKKNMSPTEYLKFCNKVKIEYDQVRELLKATK